MTSPTKTFDKGVYAADLIDSRRYHNTVKRLRTFFESKGFVEAPTQSRLSILAACEDPKTVQTYNFGNKIWPLPQTGQMWLEYELLSRPDAKGYFCISTSYRAEPNPIPGRHRTIFPMFEFEMHGGQVELEKLERELIVFLGLAPTEDAVKRLPYMEAFARYGLKEGEEIDNKEEHKIEEDFGPTLLCDFPLYTSPFWNMRLHEDGKSSRKVDVILGGQETIGSAERAIDKQEMRHQFETIANGGYADLLYQKFGKDRVNEELDDYLSFDFFPRSGGGIGVTRLMFALAAKGII